MMNMISRRWMTSSLNNMDQLSKRLREAGFTFEQSSTALKLLDNSIQRRYNYY